MAGSPRRRSRTQGHYAENQARAHRSVSFYAEANQSPPPFTSHALLRQPPTSPHSAAPRPHPVNPLDLADRLPAPSPSHGPPRRRSPHSHLRVPPPTALSQPHLAPSLAQQGNQQCDGQGGNQVIGSTSSPRFPLSSAATVFSCLLHLPSAALRLDSCLRPWPDGLRPTLRLRLLCWPWTANALASPAPCFPSSDHLQQPGSLSSCKTTVVKQHHRGWEENQRCIAVSTGALSLHPLYASRAYSHRWFSLVEPSCMLGILMACLQSTSLPASDCYDFRANRALNNSLSCIVYKFATDHFLQGQY